MKKILSKLHRVELRLNVIKMNFRVCVTNVVIIEEYNVMVSSDELIDAT
jgi:hypothetical protein